MSSSQKKSTSYWKCKVGNDIYCGTQKELSKLKMPSQHLSVLVFYGNNKNKPRVTSVFAINNNFVFFTDDLGKEGLERALQKKQPTKNNFYECDWVPKETKKNNPHHPKLYFSASLWEQAVTTVGNLTSLDTN